MAGESFRRWIEGRAYDLRSICELAPFERLDPFQLAERMGVKVIVPQDIPNLPRETVEQLLLRDSDSWSAGTLPVAENVHIVVMNPTHKETRQRASLMEELSHISLRHKPSKLMPKNGLRFRTWNKTQETEAYGVAAAALLPARILKGARSLGWTVTKVAEDHRISIALVKFRENIVGIKLTETVSKSRSAHVQLSLPL